jgi:serine/threonine-protein kinase
MTRTDAGRYRLDEVVGRGGMSTVYRANDLMLGRTVAVKVLLAALAEEDPTYVARFEREARAAAALTHRAVVTIYDAGVDDDERFIAMEYVDGRTLAEILRDRGAVEAQEAARIASEVAGALAAAHAAGILHRDIKPANVMIAGDGAVRVLDFGIARPLDGTTLTQAASLVGTAAYLSPERALGEAGDERADIYALGCLLYAMLTGGPPFVGELSAVVLHQHINSPPKPPRDVAPHVPAALDALVLAMLAKDPRDRPQTAADVRDKLAELAAPGAWPAAAAATATTEPIDRTGATSVLARRERAGPARRAALAAVLTGAIALAVIALFGGGSQSSSTSTQHTSTSTSATQPPAPASTPTAPPATTTASSKEQKPVPPGHEKKHGHDHGKKGD